MAGGGRVARVVPTTTAGVRRLPTLDAADAPCLSISGCDLVPWDFHVAIGGPDLAVVAMSLRDGTDIRADYYHRVDEPSFARPETLSSDRPGPQQAGQSTTASQRIPQPIERAPDLVVASDTYKDGEQVDHADLR